MRVVPMATAETVPAQDRPVEPAATAADTGLTCLATVLRLQGVPLSIMALAAAGIVWAVLGEVDIVAPATGSILPAGDVKLIQPAEGGIVTRIAVEEGRRVRAGDLLLTLDATAATAERDRLAKELAAAELEIARLRATLEGEE